MRLTDIFFSTWVATTLVLASGSLPGNQVRRRQDGSASSFPTLGSQDSQTTSATITSGPSETNTPTSRTATNTNSPSTPGSGSATITTTANSTPSVPPSSSASSIVPTQTSTIANNVTTTATPKDETALPLQPHITPALSIGGIVLILTGIVQALIGVKNRWIHIFLSTAYLTSLSITVLIVYVLNPPIGNAIQGAYFVGIFMTGIIFGAGSLIFKEVTEGLGCLLGGFCLSMWFLVLKPGGLMTSTGGKAIFISAFCVVCWSLSFSHYTRAYGLIGSTAFSGATAFVLGIDCFSRAGLKEFWVYIWDLNDNIFPLNTNTYPITRGTRVETIVIILGCIIGVVSQIKLWKVVKDRQREKTAAQEEDERRKEVVEAALGRHLERQNDRDRSQWEKQYGDRLTAKRETILWTDAHGEKGFTKIREVEPNESHKSSSSESLEMKNMSKKPRSMYAARVMRHSMPVTSIPEVEEADHSSKTQVRQRVLEQLEGGSSSPQPDNDNSFTSDGRSPVEGSFPAHSSALVSRGSKSSYTSNELDTRRKSDAQQYLSAPDEKKTKKRRSLVSFLSRSARGHDETKNMTQSTEALVVPEAALPYSRASSLAATLDYENDKLEFPLTHIDLGGENDTPEIVISSADVSHQVPRYSTARSVTPEPELVEESSDLDLEEFVRPPTQTAHHIEDGRKAPSGPTSAARRQSGSELGTEVQFDDTRSRRSRANTSETSFSDVLTKGAVEAMPSQLSHIVMSYRTNEWAKHISTAEAPLVEEPEPIEEGRDAEVPTHLADPATSPKTSSRSSLNQCVPPEIPLPTASTLPSATEGMRINPAVQPEQHIVSAVVAPPQPGLVPSISVASKVPRGLRSSSTPMLVSQAVQTPSMPPVPSNDIAQRPIARRSASSMTLNNLSNHPSIHKSTSRLSLASGNGVMPQLNNAQMASQPVGPYQHGQYERSPSLAGSYQAIPARSDTRLQSYDSHQPLRRNTSVENQRREAILTDWRVTQHHQHQQVSQHDHAGVHRQQMLMERQQKRMIEEQEKSFKFQQELANDARMRGRDMQELHREAMRRMQAGANKKMNPQ